MTVEEFNAKNQEESAKTANLFVEGLGIDEEIANILVSNGFSSIEEVAYVPKEELMAINEFDEQIVDALRERANDALLTLALTSDSGDESKMSDSLDSLEGMTAALAKKLNKKGIFTVEDLAEQSIDDLEDVPGLSQEKAGALIMKAREPWFSGDDDK